MNESIRNTLGFTGHRPDKLNECYSFKHPMSIKINQILTPVLEDLIIKENVNRFISGGAIGFDQIAFWTVQSLKKKYPHIKNILSIPFANQHVKWTDKETLHYYNKMLDLADCVIHVDRLSDYAIKGVPDGDYHVAKMQKRNEHVVDHSRIMVSMWNGSGGGTKNCIDYLRKLERLHYWINPEKVFELIIEKKTFSEEVKR